MNGELAIDTSYVERSAAAKALTVEEAIPKLAEIFGEYKLGISDFKDGAIRTANAAFEAGLILQSLCGHEKMSFTFWQSHLNGRVPFDYGLAKIYMSVAAKMKRKAEKIEDAYPYMQLTLIADDSIEVPRRTERQVARTIAPIQEFYNSFAAYRQQLDKVSVTYPLDQWDAEEMQRFLFATQWLADERDKVLKRLQEP